MLRENRWKVLLVVIVGAMAAEPSRAVSLVYQKPYKQIMFVPKNLYRRNRKQRVLFLDEDENHQPFGRGEIDLTVDKSYDSKIKFDDNQDYEFTSPEDQKSIAASPSGNERFYEPLPRFRPAYQAYPAYYQGRFGRPYAPGFGFDPYIPQVPFAPSRNSFYGQNTGWKARSPRVVFPYASDSVNSLVQTNSHAGPGGIDNVVFREQNFGINDIGTDEHSLQDIGSGNGDAFAERDANDHHRARITENRKPFFQKPMFIQTDGIKNGNLKRIDYYFPNVTSTVLPKFKPISDEQMLRMSQILKDMPRLSKPTHMPSLMPSTRKGRLLEVPSKDRQEGCPQGGTCEFFFYCWMVGGLLEGSCGGLLKGCCHRVAKAGILGVQDSNSIEYSGNEGLSYGPVINDESCGIAVNKQTAQRRIVGGDDAGFGTFPWQAYIRIGSSRCNMLMSIFELIGWKQCWIERCGGSLISRRHVVTAGHCVARAQPRHVRVTLGDYVINSAAEPLPAYTFGVRAIKVHPLFKFTPQADRFDVAVLTLDRNVHYMPHIAPICLPERGSDFLGQYGWAAGWGALSPGSRLRPRTLQAVDVPVLDNRVCERWHRANGINVVIYPEMLCAGYRGGGKDSCQGDSGGPLMLERTGRWYLIGVVSAGYSCASRGQPGIYHRVAHTVDWISHATTLS
ncbi:plasma kallikrein [Pectinophora gossypiella]|uniref:plasma kallikrein n=1 Tax=Pectinophora gossypiella TaxID=13191 RepID=UPI00214E0E63|nr:plasma kallikrein [Pectinophora gossypiella]